MDFDHGIFGMLADTVTGKEIWEFLKGREMTIVIELAVEAKLSVLEVVEQPLLDRFGDIIWGRSWRAMVGRMTRQILEHRGYICPDYVVKTRSSDRDRQLDHSQMRRRPPLPLPSYAHLFDKNSMAY